MKNRAMIPALLAASLFCLFSVSNASAGLFGHRAAGCDSGCAAVEPTCGCEAAEPTCGCEADACCNPCKRRTLGPPASQVRCQALLRADLRLRSCSSQPVVAKLLSRPAVAKQMLAAIPASAPESWPACEPSALPSVAVSPLVVAKLLSRPVVAKQMLAAIPASARNLGPPASQVRCQALL